MRSLVITAALIAGAYQPAGATPSWPAFETGWCTGLVSHQVVQSRTNVVTSVFDATLSPATLPKGRPSERDSIGFVSTNGWSAHAKANVVGATIELSTDVHRCEDTGAGCVHGRAKTWGGDVFESIAVPKGTCIEYLSRLPGGLVLGTSTGTYAIASGQHAVKVTAPRLQKVTATETVVLARNGTTLQAIRWPDGKPAPTFEPIPAVMSPTVAAHVRDDTVYVFTEQAVIVFDAETLVEKWQLPGRYHALLMPASASEWAFLRIEHDQVILDVRSVTKQEPGAVLRSRVVYKGPAIDADVTLLDAVYKVDVAQQP